MSYIGNEPNVGTFIVGVERFNGTGSCTQFTLTQTGIQDSNAIEVLVNSIQQDPTNSYSVANGVITFTEAPSSGANNIIVTYRATTVITYGNVGTSQILDGSITTSKLASGVLPDAKANSAAVYANSAFSTANSAGVYANAAFAQANTGGAGASYANSAFLQANTPSYVANSAASYANSSFATANSAAIYANSAFTKANNAGSNGSFSVTSTGLAVSLVGTAITGYKILGQIATTANAITNVYVVPATTSASIGTITVCNGTQNDVLFDLVMRPSTEALATKHYLLKSITIPAADTLILDSGVTLNTGAILAANTIGANAGASAAGVSVHAYGVEIV